MLTIKNYKSIEGHNLFADWKVSIVIELDELYIITISNKSSSWNASGNDKAFVLNRTEIEPETYSLVFHPILGAGSLSNIFTRNITKLDISDKGKFLSHLIHFLK